MRKSDCDVFKILNNLPLIQVDDSNSFILYGSRDVPEIIRECLELESLGETVVRLDDALHSDIFLYEPTFKLVNQKLKEWYD